MSTDADFPTTPIAKSKKKSTPLTDAPTLHKSGLIQQRGQLATLAELHVKTVAGVTTLVDPALDGSARYSVVVEGDTACDAYPTQVDDEFNLNVIGGVDYGAPDDGPMRLARLMLNGSETAAMVQINRRVLAGRGIDDPIRWSELARGQEDFEQLTHLREVTLLVLAVYSGRLPLVQRVLELGANVNWQTRNTDGFVGEPGGQLIHLSYLASSMALDEENTAILELLIDRGMRLDVVEDVMRDDSLLDRTLMAYVNGQYDDDAQLLRTLRALLQGGAVGASTALDVARRNGHAARAIALLEASDGA